MGLAETAELAVRISLKDNASAGVRGLQRNLAGLSGSVARVGKGVGQVGAGLTRAGLVIGTGLATGLTLAAKTAIDFQDAFAGVRKTVEGTPAQLEEMYTGLRKLATRIPVKFTDLAAIAQEAGALGVAQKDVVGFTDVVARLSAATVGLTTDAAAEAFGKLGNVLFTTKEKADGLIEEYNRMGSALVALGNAGASSEGDIIEVAKRFGAAGHAAGLTAAQILGMSSAVASLGIEPEAAGGALSRLFNNLTTNLALGNSKAKAFGATLGLTAKQAKTAFGKDALGTFEAFLKSLAGMDKFEQAKVLKGAGITNSRDINAIRLMSQQYAEVARQVDLSTKAYAENTQLADISAKRFDTLKNKLITLKNLFFDSAVTVAEGFTPALGRAADKIREILSQSGNQSALVSIGKDIGAAIDGINWSDVISGAQSMVSLFKGALGVAKDILGILNSLPGPVKEAGLAFLTLNKLSGGLIGNGVGNIVGGLGETIVKALGSKLPGVGKLFAQPVFVTNWPLGGVGGAGGAGGGMSMLGLGMLGLGAVALPLILQAVQDNVVMPALQEQAGKNIQGTQGVIDSRDPAKIATALQGVKDSVASLSGLQKIMYDLNANGVKTHTEGLEAALAGALASAQVNTSGSPDDRQDAQTTQSKLDALRDRIEASRIATVSAVGSTTGQVRTSGAGIVGAIRGIDIAPRVHVTVRNNVAVTANSIKRAFVTTSTYSAGHIGAVKGMG